MADEVTTQDAGAAEVADNGTEETAETTAVETTAEASPETSNEEVTQPEKDSLEDWKAQSRKHEKAAKELRKDLERQTELFKKLAEKVGLDIDEEAAPTVDALTDKLTTAQKVARDKSVELAVYKSASKLEADVNALLDSRTFLNKVESLDPEADDFDESVNQAITDALEANPKLKVETRPAVKKIGTEMKGGTAQKVWTRKELEEMSLDEYKANEAAILKQLRGN